MSTRPPREKRSKRLLDVSLQLSIPLSMCGTLLFLTAVYVVSLAWFGRDALDEDSRGLQRLALAVTGVYLLVSLAATFGVGVIVTHRIAGPVTVIQAALRGMRAGDYGRRIGLRRRDHLHALAAEVSAFRDDLLRERAARRGALQLLEGALAGGDLEQARTIARSLLLELDGPGRAAESLLRASESRRIAS